MNHQQEVHQFDDTHFGEINLAQHIVMVVVGYYIVCIGLYGTINKLIVIRGGLTGKFLFLLTEPLMQIHFVNFVKAFLVQFARLPHLLSHFVEFLGKIVGDKLLDVVQLLVALDGRKNIKQIELCGIEYSRLYTFHNNIYLQFCCKDTK